MEINKVPLNKLQADRLKIWLHKPEFELLIEQLRYRKLILEHEALARMLQYEDEPFAEKEAKELIRKANAMQMAIDEVQSIAGVSDLDDKIIEPDLFRVEVNPIVPTINLTT